MSKRRTDCRWLVILALLLCSCGPGLQKGYVYAHHLYPAWTQVIPGHEETVCTGTRKTIRCRTTYDPPIIIEHPETYEIDISNCTHNVGSSECRTNALYVSEETYDRYPVGSYYGGGN